MGAGMRYQPQRNARVIGRFAGATFCANRNIKTGAPLTTLPVTTAPVGIAATVTLSSGQVTPIGVAVTPSWTLLVVIQRGAGTSYPYFLGISGAANPIALTMAHPNIGAQVGWFDGTTLLASGFVVNTGALATIALSYDGATGVYTWAKDGVVYNITAGANTGGGVWQFAAAANESNTQYLPLLHFAPVAATAAELKTLTANPWQLFDAGASRAYQAAIASAVAPPGGANVTPGAGALALTGYAPTVGQTAARSVTPGAGSLALTGYAPTVSQSSAAQANPGPAALALTGYAPTVTQSAHRIVAPGTASLSFTGYAPTVSQRAGVTPNIYAFTIMDAAPLYRTADLGPDAINLTGSLL